MPVTLILGGARSGKSRRAEAIALSLSEHPVYIATAPVIAEDVEWQARIAHHQQRRGEHWLVIEEPVDLIKTLHGLTGRTVVIDCLTLWLSNLMHAGRDVAAETNALCKYLIRHDGNILLVSNEVGMGLVPETELGREFRDAQGRLNQAVAAVAEQVIFVVAGLSMTLKGESGDDCKD